jgi:hypothetical protein
MRRRFAAEADGNALGALGRYLAAGVFVSDFLPDDDDDDDESEEPFDDPLDSDDDELSDDELSEDELPEDELSEDESLLLEAETPSLCSFISRARFLVP